MKSDNVSSGQQVKTTTAWFKGVNSVRNPWSLTADQLKWAVNCSVRGGIVQTRSGNRMRLSLPAGNLQGGIIFSANKQYNPASTTISLGSTTTKQATIYGPDGNEISATQKDYIVFAVGGSVYFSEFPLVQPKDWNTNKLTGIQLDPNANLVSFCIASKSSNINKSGNTTLVPTYRTLIIQDGVSPAVYWDGSNKTGGVAEDMPIGYNMAFSGQRLWVANGAVVYASDLGDPLSWRERREGIGRGDFSFPQDITALTDFVGQNNDTRLIVFTANATYSLGSGILDRTQWPTTPNFQNTLFGSVGCVAQNSIALQSGQMWWYARGGLVSADVAASSYLSSEILYKDVEMARAKRLMASDISNICAVSFENYLLYSIPYQEKLNSATMVMDYAVASEWNTAKIPAWCGVWTGTRPIVWTTGVIDNQPRCFHFSVDYVPTNDGSYNHLWESFMPERIDSYLQINSDGSTTTRYNRIYSQIETALLGDSIDLKQFLYAELECSQIGGTADVRVSYKGSKGAYQKILETRLLAVTDAYQYEHSSYEKVIEELGILNTQYRRLVTEAAQVNSTPTSCESKYLLNVDKAFSILVEWCGEFGIEAIQTYTTPYSERSNGVTTAPETKSCVVGEDGTSIAVVLEESPYLQPPSEKISWTSTKSVSINSNCPEGSEAYNVTATATASFISFVSQENADQQATSLATEQATSALQKYRQQNPC